MTAIAAPEGREPYKSDTNKIIRLSDDDVVEKLLQQRRTNQDLYQDFYKHLLRFEVGCTKWDSLVKRGWCADSGGPNNYISTTSDEAMAILHLENNRLYWNGCVDQQQREDRAEFEGEPVGPITSVTIPMPLYTANKRLHGEKNKGWSDAGIKRFNEIMRIIKEDRSKNGKEFEARFVEEQRGEKKRKRGMENQAFVMADFGDGFGCDSEDDDDDDGESNPPVQEVQIGNNTGLAVTRHAAV